MSLKARIDKLSRELAFGDLFDGCTMEELSSNGFFGEHPNENARPGVKRCAAFHGILIIRDSAAETRAEYGIPDDATHEQIKERLLELGTEAGLTEKEMKSLSESIG